MTGVFIKRGHFDRDMRRGIMSLKIKAKVRMTDLQVKEHQGLPANHQTVGVSMEQMLSTALRRTDSLILHFYPPVLSK